MEEFEYLAYTLKKNGGQNVQIRKKVKQAATVIGQVWGTEKKKFGKDWC